MHVCLEYLFEIRLLIKKNLRLEKDRKNIICFSYKTFL